MKPALLPIGAIAKKLAIDDAYFEPLGRHAGKIQLELLSDPRYPLRGKLILVTATTPTTAGEGKTVTSIGLVQGLERIGKSCVLTTREPSIGPVFGIKGGGAGGGLASVEPSEKINLHFTGDFHAITAAHNLLAASLDAHIHHGNALDLDPGQLVWPRAIDMCDRALRRITVGHGKSNGPEHPGGFVITSASEIMAIMALAAGRADLRQRLGRIALGYTRAGRLVTAAELGITGSLMALLNDAILPNLAQTTEGTPAIVHIGPFANIATGTSSILAHRMGLHLADYVVNEVGFASDLGGEKYFDVVMRTSGIAPSAAVLVTTVRSVREQGQGDLAAGLANFDRHIRILQRFGVPVVVAINRFADDAAADLDRLARHAASLGVPSALSEAYTRGGAGCTELAQAVVDLIAARPGATPQPVYSLDDSLEDKIRSVAREVYGAAGVAFSETAQRSLARIAAGGFSGLPVCIAKTQYSLSDDPKLSGAPTDWTLQVTDASVNAGAGFVVVLAGRMLLMPGLPLKSRAQLIDVDASGNITGLV